MNNLTLPRLQLANAHFVTGQLVVGGDLAPRDLRALQQLAELADAGVTHIVDVRLEHSDEALVAAYAAECGSEIGYLHHGVDDRGQRIPAEWFERGVQFALRAISAGGIVLAHCHMGINRGPSLGFAVLLAQGWDPVEALSAIRGARPIAYIDYADDALAWHHERSGSTSEALRVDLGRVAAWRRENRLDVGAVIRGIRMEESRGGL